MKPSSSVKSAYATPSVPLRPLPLPVRIPSARAVPVWRPPRPKRRSPGRRFAGALLLLAGGVAGLDSAGVLRPGPESVAPWTPRGGGRVAAEGLVVALPGAEVRLAAERAGRLLRVLVHEGERVRSGQLLAEIEASDLQAALARAQARLAESEAERRLAARSLDRLRQLVRLDISPPNALDEAQRDLDIARARSEFARAETSFQQAQIRATRVVAPFSGTVTERHATAGETVAAGQPVVTVADLTRLQIEAEADEADAGALGVGATVLITADGYPGRTWRGRLEELGEAVTPRRLRTQDPRRASDTRILSMKVGALTPLPLKLGTTVQIAIEPSGETAPAPETSLR